MMKSHNWIFGRRSSRRKQINTETLESRTLLSTFYVNGIGAGNGQGGDGSEAAPFARINDGVQAALANPGDDEVVIIAKATSAYSELVLVVNSAGRYPAGDLTIRGATGNASDVVLNSTGGTAFHLEGDINVTIQDLTLRGSGGHGLVNRADGLTTIDNVQVIDHVGPQGSYSGLIHQNGDMIVRNSFISNSYQGIWTGNWTDSSGALLSAPDSLTVENTTSNDNLFHGVFVNPGMAGGVTLTDVTAQGNDWSGVSIYGAPSVSVAGGVFTDNLQSGLRVENSTVSVTDGHFADNGFAGGLFVRTSGNSISGSSFVGNALHGLRLDLTDGATIDGVTADGNGSVLAGSTIGGGGIRLNPANSAPIVVRNSAIRNNRTRGWGAGIEVVNSNSTFLGNVTVSGTVIENNETYIGSDLTRLGGGISSANYASLTIEDSVVSGNAAWHGGGVSFTTFVTSAGEYGKLTVRNTTVSDNSGIGGVGGITQSNGTTEIASTTISGNTGVTGGARILGSNGFIENTTISGNVASGFANSFVNIGGLDVNPANSFLISNSTITRNEGDFGGGLGSRSLVTTIQNSVVAGNVSALGEDWDPPQPNDLRGGVTSRGGNLVGAVNPQIGFFSRNTQTPADQVGTVSAPIDAMLGDLQDNGGLTLTHAPPPGSPLLDAGTLQVSALPSTDQRGVARPQRFGVDIGAVEIANLAPSVAAVSTAITVNEGQTAANSGSFGDPEGDTVTLTASSGILTDNGDGSWSWTQAIDDGPTDGTVVTITATDQFGATTSTTFTVTALNVVPIAAVSGPNSTLQGDFVQVSLSATDVSTADAAAGFTYQIDWDNDGIIDEVVTAGSSTAVAHQFTAAGLQTFTVTAVDKDGGVSSVVSHSLNVIALVTTSYSNSVNLNNALKGKATFEIVIHSTAAFDASTIDVSTVLWAGAGVYRSRLKDVDRDGDRDLTLRFLISQTTLLNDYRNAMAINSSNNHQQLNYMLTGTTHGGTGFAGATSLDLFMTGKSLRDLLDTL